MLNSIGSPHIIGNEKKNHATCLELLQVHWKVTFLQDFSQCTWMLEDNIGITLKHYIGTPMNMGGAQQDHNLSSILIKNSFLNGSIDCCSKMFTKRKKKHITYKLSTSTRTCAKMFGL